MNCPQKFKLRIWRDSFKSKSKMVSTWKCPDRFMYAFEAFSSGNNYWQGDPEKSLQIINQDFVGHHLSTDISIIFISFSHHYIWPKYLLLFTKKSWKIKVPLADSLKQSFALVKVCLFKYLCFFTCSWKFIPSNNENNCERPIRWTLTIFCKLPWRLNSSYLRVG